MNANGHDQPSSDRPDTGPAGGLPPPPQVAHWPGHQAAPPAGGPAQWGYPPQVGYGQPPGYGVPPPEGGLLENAVKVVTAPVDTLRRLTHHPRVGWSIAAVAVVGLLGFVAGMAGVDSGPAPGEPFAPGAGFEAFRGMLLVVGVVLGPLLALLFVLVWAAILHGMARLLKGTGTFAGTFTGVSFAYVVTLLAVPFQLLPLAVGAAGTFLATLVSFGTAIWSVVLDAIAVRECHHLTTGRAAAAVLVPIAVFFVLAVLFVVFAIALVVGGLAGMTP